MHEERKKAEQFELNLEQFIEQFKLKELPIEQKKYVYLLLNETKKYICTDHPNLPNLYAQLTIRLQRYRVQGYETYIYDEKIINEIAPMFRKYYKK